MNLRTIRSAILSILDANNTTTSSSDISASLQTRVQKVIAGHPKRPVGLDEYPVVFVSLSGKTESAPFLGNVATRDMAVTWTVHCLTCLSDSATSAENECITLADNVEKCLRNYIDLSGTVDYSNLEDTEYTLEDADSTYVHTARIGLLTKLWSRT